MPSTFSTNLGIELITTGEQAGTWGATTNTNLGTLIEQAISGYVAQVITDGADTVITIPSGSTGVARNMTLELTGALSAARNLIVPSNRKLYFIYNNTTGGYAVTVKVSGQTGVSVPNGAKVLLVSNGTDVVNAVNYIPALYFSAGTAAAPSISTIGDTNTGIYFPAADNISLTTSGTQRVTLDSSGRLGLGTGSPVGKLQINDGSGRNVIVTTDATQLGTSGMAVGSFNDNASAYAPLTLLGSALHLATGGLERARVTANGNLLVGTTNDNAGKIRIAGVGQPLVFDSSGATTSQLVGPEWRASDNSLRAFIKDTTESPTGGEFRIATNIVDSYFTFATGNNTERMRLDAAGNLGIGTSSPGARVDVRLSSSADFVRLRGATSGNSNLVLQGDDGNGSAWWISTKAAGYLAIGGNGGTEPASGVLNIDGNGNVGLSQTPPPNTSYPGLFLQNSVSFIPYNGDGYLFYNAYSVGANQLRYRSSGLAATAYAFNQSGEHIWYNAPSGTAGTAVTFSERMRITSSGNLGVGTSSPDTKLTVTVADTAVSTRFKAVTGVVRFRPYVDTTLGAIIDSSNAAESAYLPFTLIGSTLRLFGGGGTGATIDASGNLGLGVTPSAWSVGAGRVLQVNAAGYYGDSTQAIVSSNGYYNTSWKYVITAPASRYEQSSGVHNWYTAGSGTAGNAISFTQAMTLDASGNLGVGTASPGAAYRLHLSNTGSDAIAQINTGLSTGSAYWRAENSSSFVYSAGMGPSSGAATPFTNNGGYVYTNGSGGLSLISGNGSAPMVFSTNNTERARITSGGDLLIGTTTSAYKTTAYVSGLDGFCVQNSATGTGTENGFIFGLDTNNDGLVWSFDQVNIRFGTNNAERARIDSSGNLGLGVTPSAWVSGAKAFQAGGYASFGQGRAGTSDLVASWNAIVTSGTSSGTGYVYRNTGDVASSYEQNGQHRWYTAPSGTAGNAITFTQAMTLDASGNLLVGTTSTAGSQLNTTNAVVGKITSHQGTVSATNGTATTMFSITAGGGSTFLVTVSIIAPDTGSNYTVLGLLRCAGTNTYTNIVTSTTLTVALSGTNLQATQNSGLTQTINWSILRLL